MTLYAAFEWLVIVLLLAVSARFVWQRVIQPALQRPKAVCSSVGCNSCARPK